MSTKNQTDTPQALKTQSNTPGSNTQKTHINCLIQSETDGHTQKQLEAGKLRKKVADELLQTEKTYVQCLDNLIRHFMMPLQKMNNKLLISSTEHQIIFPSIIKTIYGFHTKLLIELAKVHAHWNNNTSKIGNIFVKYGQLFKMYQAYMNNHEKAASCLSELKAKNAKFSEWCVKTRQKAKNYGLDSLLIVPIQRIPRFLLLLKELIKRTEEYDIYHTDLYDLKNAYNSISKVTILINDRMKQNDRRQKVRLIENKFDAGLSLVTPARFFVAETSDNEDYVIKYDKYGTQIHIVLFIFNDCLIYGHYEIENMVSPSAFLGRDLLKFDHLIRFDEMFKLEDVPMQRYQNLHCVKIFGGQHSLWVSFKTKQSKFEWMKLLTETNAKANKRTIKSINKHKYNIDIPYPLFVPDDYSNKCLSCNSKFSLINRRHHCNYCGILACSKCTDYKLESAWKNEIVRVCDVCHAKYKDETEDESVDESDDFTDTDNYPTHTQMVPVLSLSQSPLLPYSICFV